LKETLKKKQRIIDNKKKMNLLLVDLAKIKKGEVQCLETLHYTQSTNLKDTLQKIRDNEKEIFSKLEEISAMADNSDSDEENNEDSEGVESDFDCDDG